MIAISLSPNTTRQDILTALAVLHTPFSWNNETHTASASALISKFFYGRFVSMKSSGRQALFDLLRAYGIGRGDEVIIQAFTCIAVPAPIIWAGALPVYADIEKNTYNIDPAQIEQRITSRTKAIIIQHTFGIPARIKEISDIAKKHNLLLIEDVAHSLGGEYGEHLLGTFGDAAILSFGRDKTISSVFGGAVISKDKQLIERIESKNKQRPFPPRLWVLQQLLHPLLFAVIVPNYFRLSLGKALLIAAQKIGLLSKAVAVEERISQRPNHTSYRYSPALAQLLISQLDQLKVFTARRQAIANAYQSKLSTTDVILPSIPADSTPAWLRFPVQVPYARQTLLKARRHNMLLGDWYDGPLAPGNCALSNFHYIAGSCPIAEQTAKHVINLPTYPRMTKKNVTQVTQFIRKNLEHSDAHS